MGPIILASASPRRSDLLTQIGIPFEVEVSGVDEAALVFDDPVTCARTLSLHKAQAVAERQTIPGRIVLGADSIVVLDDQILGKPDDKDDARSMLHAITGRMHTVITGFALVETGTNKTVQAHEQTNVWIRACSDEEIEAYLSTDESLDKAGAYGAQGYGAALVERVEGCFYNVVGLPLAQLIVTLQAFRKTITNGSSESIDLFNRS